MDADVQIRDRLVRELAEGGAPPLGSLVADAIVAGGRLRRRRRFAMSAGAGGGLVAMVAAGVFVVSNAGGANTSNTLLPGGPKPAPSAATRVTGGEQKATTGEAVIALLTQLLPPGGHISEVEVSTGVDHAGGSLLFDDGHGAATVFAAVADKPADYGPSVTGMQCPPNGEDFVCTRGVTADGSEVRVLTMGPNTTACTDLKCSIKDLRVEVARPDGTYVTAEATNGPFGHGRAATRADTLLSTDQLIAIASDPRWGMTTDASFVDNAKRTVHTSSR
jgi:hypothetical protein